MTVSLYTSALASVAHDTVFLPWLRRAAAIAPASPNAVAVLIPQRSDAYYLKALALASGIGLWGVHFLTPSDLRDRLREHLALTRRIPLREHLRLLLATAAERISGSSGERAVNAIAIAPDELLKAIDMIGGAGWEYDEAGPHRLKRVVAGFHRLLDRAGWQMVHQADRDALTAAKEAPPCFAELFVIGFNGLHWPQWPLLEAAVRLADRSVVCLTEPRPGSEDLDGAWNGTWENTFDVAEPIGTDRTMPFVEAMTAPETKEARLEREAAPIREIEFLAGLDTADHARAIVARALQYLADPKCERLGVLFSTAGALSRRVAMLLEELAVPHHDGLAHQAPGPLEDAAWPAWLALQESPRGPLLRRFLEAQSRAPLGDLSSDTAVYELQRAIQELLIDDLEVIAEYLSMDPRENARALAEALRELPLLPETALLGEFFSRSGEIFRLHGWTERADLLQTYREDWQRSFSLRISRRTWLRWLQETLVSWKAHRAEAGSHPYSRLHLLPYLHAESQSWTHLIATGLNEGQWPPTIEESGFLDEEEIAALNGQVRTLNQRASMQGRQGEGHLAVRPGKGLCLGPAQRRILVEREFLNTLESASIGISATMQLRDEAAPERPLNPSEFFSSLYFAARGQAVSQQTLSALQEETARWVKETGVWKSPSPPSASVQATRQAFDARRDADQPFGEYEFALRDKPPVPLRLTATEWEGALSSPASVFLKVVLRVSSNEQDDETPWARTQGTWVHRWLSVLADPETSPELAPLPAAADLRERVRGAADAFRRQVFVALNRRGQESKDWWDSAWQPSDLTGAAVPRRELPDWWQSTWQQAKSSAGQLVDSVAAVKDWAYGATEWRIADTAIPLENGTLYIRGRIDLLLSVTGALEDLWLVDYKTGNYKLPRKKDSAPNLQLVLYALALQSLGARNIGISLLTPATTLEEPQYHLPGIEGLGAERHVLLRMQESGTFGMLEPLRAEFGFSQGYPLATLAIEPDILVEKWLKTNPELAPAEEEDEP
ncbi:MAG TPA: PD-(D/E)XK nuclease family protein [Chthoniobacter sp.]|jgi:hypothetical protein